MEAEQAATVRGLFTLYGVEGADNRVATPLSDDEIVFVISARAAAAMKERELTVALSALLGRKVWVTTDGPQWHGRTKPLS